MGRGVAGPSKTGAVVTHYGCELRDAVLYKRPADRTGSDSGFQNNYGTALSAHIDMQLPAADIDHASRWWVSRYHVVV